MSFYGLINVAEITPFLITLILPIVGLLILLSQWVSERKMDFLKRNGIPVLRISPVWYTLLKYVLPKNQEFHPVARMTQWNEGVEVLHRRENMFAVVTANETFVHVFKPESIEAITTSNTLINKPWMYNFIRPLVGDGLLTSAGEKWRARRKMLTPTFHFKILETFMPIFNFHSLTLIRKIKTQSEDTYIDVVPRLSLCTLDVIGETAMGIKINSQENEGSEYVKSIVRLEELLIERTMLPWYWWDFIYYLSPKGRECKRALKIVNDFTRKVVSERKLEVKKQLEEGKLNFGTSDDSENVYLNTKNRMAFLDLLLYRHLTDGSISEQDICEEVDTFMFEGHDTTAMGVSWALHSLGLYPDIQDKAYKEIEDIFGKDRERPVTVEDTRKMKYLESVIKEALRLYPPVPVILRRVQENTNILGKIIPAKSVCHVSLIGLHHDPETFPNPQVFDPERFFTENAGARHPFAFIPFSAGPRNCIGQKFAMMEEKTIISNVLRHFHITSLEPRDKVISCAEMVLRPLNGLKIKFTER